MGALSSPFKGQASASPGAGFYYLRCQGLSFAETTAMTQFQGFLFIYSFIFCFVKEELLNSTMSSLEICDLIRLAEQSRITSFISESRHLILIPQQPPNIIHRATRINIFSALTTSILLQTYYILLINLSALSPFSFVGCTHRIWLWITCHLHRNLSFVQQLTLFLLFFNNVNCYLFFQQLTLFLLSISILRKSRH